MAKRRKNIGVLLIVLVVISLVTIIVKNIDVQKEKIANIEDTIVDIDKDDIDSISWTYGSTTISLNNTDGTWYLESDDKFPVNQDVVEGIANKLACIDVSFIIEEVSDYSQYGLNRPTCKVTYKANDTEYTIEFGDYSMMDSERYVNVNDGNVYLLTNDIMDNFNITVDDLFNYETIPDISNFIEMKVSGENNLDIIYDDDNSYTYSKLFTYFLKSDGNKTLGNSEVESLTSVIKNLSFDSYATYTANSDDLSVYGLYNPRIKVEFNYLNEDDKEETFIIELSSDIIPEEDESYKCYARISGSDIVYSINQSSFTRFIEAAYDNLRPSEVLMLEDTDIKEIDINLDDENYTILSEVDDDEVIYKLNDEEVSFSDVIDELNALEIVEYVDETSSKTMQLAITLHLNNENYESLTLKFYKYDADNSLLVFSNNYKALVSRQSVLDLIESINTEVLTSD